MKHRPRTLSLLAIGFALSSCSDHPSGPGTPGLDLSLPGSEPVARSYEVAIATAAADQVRGLEECSARAKPAQADCRKLVNDAYQQARSAALLIRGTDR